MSSHQRQPTWQCVFNYCLCNGRKINLGIWLIPDNYRCLSTVLRPFFYFYFWIRFRNENWQDTMRRKLTKTEVWKAAKQNIFFFRGCSQFYVILSLLVIYLYLSSFIFISYLILSIFFFTFLSYLCLSLLYYLYQLSISIYPHLSLVVIYLYLSSSTFLSISSSI